MFDETAVVLDFETTGLSCDEGHRVTEVAALRVRENRIVDVFTSLVNCERRIPPHIVGFTGISQAMVDTAPPAAEVICDLLAFIGDDQVIAHNAWFDRGFLEMECNRERLAYAGADFLCSYRIARQVLPTLQSHALGCLATHLHIPFTPGAHRAYVDATVTAHVLFRLCDRIGRERGDTRVSLAALRALSTIPDAAVATAA